MRPVPAKYPVTLDYRQKPKFDPNYIHRGIDYGCPSGTPVVATVGGTVVWAGDARKASVGSYGPAYGIQVIIKTGEIYALYAHLSSEQVTKGDRIPAGTVIGKSGATGNTRGAHLHYQECTEAPPLYKSDRKPEFIDGRAPTPLPPEPPKPSPSWPDAPAHWYPLADRKTQNFTGNFSASPMDTNCVILHSTEGTGWPGYNNGGSAPHMTIMPDFKNKKVIVRQHLAGNKSARALENRSGGVETNTANVFQIEMVGTCDPRTHTAWRNLDHIYMPDPPQWYIDGVADVMKWLDQQYPKFKIVDGAPRGWSPYPASYGATKFRFTRAEWLKFYGIAGHQHVPENCVHPDTMILKGDMTWSRAGDLVTGDRLVGFDEENGQVGSTAGRRFREATATVHGVVEKDSYRITMTDGTTVVSSADHKWLVNLPYVNRGSRIQWVETQHLNPAIHQIKSLGAEPWSEVHTKDAGYIAGAIDCDGSVVFNTKGDAHFGFGQCADYGYVLDRFEQYLIDSKLDYHYLTRDWAKRKSGFASKADFTDIRVRGGLWKTCKALAEIGPLKFDQVRDNCWVNRVVGKTTQTSELLSVEHIGPQPVVSLETSTRTYVADGLLCHNTHGDPGNFPIKKLIAAAKGEAPVPAPEPTPTPEPEPEPTPDPVDPRMDPKNYGPGKTGDHITWLGERLVLHGFGKHYRQGPGPTWGEADELNVRDFQLAQGWSGSGANGLPGPETLKRLAADPVQEPTPEPEEPDFEPAPEIPDPQVKVRMRAAIGNANVYWMGKWDARADNVADVFKRAGASLALIAEMYSGAAGGRFVKEMGWGDADNQVDSHASPRSTDSYDVHGGPHAGVKLGAFWDPTKRRVLELEDFWTTENPRHRNSGSMAVLLKDIETGHLSIWIPLHLEFEPVGKNYKSHWGNKRRYDQANAAFEKGRALATKWAAKYKVKRIPVFVGGDMNGDMDDPYDGPGVAAKKHGFVDSDDAAEKRVTVGSTHAKAGGLKPGGRIDRWFVEKWVRVIEQETHNAYPHTDHNVVEIYVEFDNN